MSAWFLDSELSTCLQKPGSGQSIRVSVLCFPVIFSSLPLPVTLTDCPHLEGLELADQLKGSQDTIDMHIGLDFYWTIVMEGIRQHTHGPVASWDSPCQDQYQLTLQ